MCTATVSFFRSLNIKQNHTTKQRQSRVTSGQQKCRNTVRKAKEQNELQLVWNIKKDAPKKMQCDPKSKAGKSWFSREAQQR